MEGTEALFTRKSSKKLTLQTVLKREFNRYRVRGWNLVIAFVWGLIMLKIVTIFGHYIWPKALDFIETNKIEKWKFLFYFSWIYNFFWYFFINFLFWIIYHIDHPFFEQYKIIKEPWPWN